MAFVSVLELAAELLLNTVAWCTALIRFAACYVLAGVPLRIVGLRRIVRGTVAGVAADTPGFHKAMGLFHYNYRCFFCWAVGGQVDDATGRCVFQW